MLQIALLLALFQAQLSGEVTDASGAVAPGATVVLTELQTDAELRAVAGVDGSYAFALVRSGLYRIEVRMTGFEKIVREGISISTGDHLRLDFQLRPEGGSTSVTVQPDALMLRADAANLGQTVDGRRITDLPLNGRSFVTLAQLAPGVALPPNSSLPRINGGRPRTNEYLYDGISVLLPEPGQVAFMPVIDSIREFRIEINSPSAEFGRFNGGVVNLTMKSGTNQFHGSIFEFFRNEALNARNLFAPAAKPRFRRHQFGFVLGGPIVRNRAFFFADYQGLRQEIGRVRISTVPLEEQRQGGRIDPVTAALLLRYPLPNAPGPVNNFMRVGNESSHQDQGDLRIDHQITSASRMFARLSRLVDFQNPVTPLPDGSGALTAGALGHMRTLGDSFAAGILRSGSRITNEGRLGITRRSLRSAALALATYVIPGYQQIGPTPGAFARNRTGVTEIADTLAFQRGRHLIKTGFDFRWERMDAFQQSSPFGVFTFSAAQTGSAFSSFLLGLVDRYSIDLQQKTLRPRARIQEYFFQDDWKSSRRLALNLGVRYTLNFPSTEVDDQGAVFNLRTEQLDFLGQNGFSRSARQLHKLNFGPRLGVAYRLNEETAVRSGYALVWIEQSGITTPFTNPYFPFVQTLTERSLDGVSPAFSLSQGPGVAWMPPSAGSSLGQGAFAVDRQLGSGYVQQWNVSIQRQLNPETLIELAWAGSKITHVGIPDTNLNQLAPRQLALGSQLLESVANPYFGVIPRSSSLGAPAISRAQLLKPYPRFTNITLFRNNVGNSNYNAFQAKIDRRFSSGLSFLASYTRSKLIDEASSVFDASILSGPTTDVPVADSHNRRLERDVSTGDIPNIFVASISYDLGHGWSVAVIATCQSGTPLAVTQITNFNSFAGFGAQRPDRLGRTALSRRERSTSRFFDTSAFSIAPQFTLGNSSRNPVRGPGYGSADIAVTKRIRAAELRAEVFNLTNTPPLGIPNVLAGSPGFGTINSAGDPRVFQLALKLRF